MHPTPHSTAVSKIDKTNLLQHGAIRHALMCTIAKERHNRRCFDSYKHLILSLMRPSLAVSSGSTTTCVTPACRERATCEIRRELRPPASQKRAHDRSHDVYIASSCFSRDYLYERSNRNAADINNALETVTSYRQQTKGKY